RGQALAIGDACCFDSHQPGGAMMSELQEEIAQHKLGEDALRQSEQQWQQIFEHNPVSYFMVDATGIILSVNACGASQLGYTVTELVGRSVLDVSFEEDREVARRNLAACLETIGQSNSWEVRKIRKDGTVLWTRENTKAVRWAGDQLIVLIACEDITERHWRELESVRLAAIVSSSDDAVVSKTLDGTVTSWNAGAASSFAHEQ